MFFQLFSEIGLSDGEMDEFFTGPAFLPWFTFLFVLNLITLRYSYILFQWYTSSTKRKELSHV